MIFYLGLHIRDKKEGYPLHVDYAINAMKLQQDVDLSRLKVIDQTRKWHRFSIKK